MAEDLPLKQQIYIKVLLNHFHPGEQETLLKGLPANQSREISGLNVVANDPSIIFLHPAQALMSIHYSWIAQELAKQPQALHGFFLASLLEPQRTAVGKYITQTNALSLPPLLADYFCHQLYIALGMKELLPREFLPNTPVLRLLDFSKPKLVNLIDFFGLYDLAEEIRTIVDTKNLKHIYACLTPKKHQFLRLCLHQKERLVVPKLHLEKWDTSCSELHKKLHRRGLARLGKALSNQHHDFLWYLSHTLDRGRGQILIAQAATKESESINSILNNQLLNLIHFLEGSK
ncbi:MAG: hypothetical protein ACSNEK_03430 [Parachlamydiaceae bacterium]